VGGVAGTVSAGLPSPKSTRKLATVASPLASVVVAENETGSVAHGVPLVESAVTTGGVGGAGVVVAPAVVEPPIMVVVDGGSDATQAVNRSPAQAHGQSKSPVHWRPSLVHVERMAPYDVEKSLGTHVPAWKHASSGAVGHVSVSHGRAMHGVWPSRAHTLHAGHSAFDSQPRLGLFAQRPKWNVVSARTQRAWTHAPLSTGHMVPQPGVGAGVGAGVPVPPNVVVGGGAPAEHVDCGLAVHVQAQSALLKHVWPLAHMPVGLGGRMSHVPGKHVSCGFDVQTTLAHGAGVPPAHLEDGLPAHTQSQSA
jgi:hypothetical protein